MPELRSRTSTHGRTMAGARALWRATGMTDDDFGKPIVAIANSFTQFVPGHVHLKDMGGLVADVDRRGRRDRPRVQHHRRRRRHRDGPRRHALLAAQPRADRRRRRIHGQRALRRRPGLHLQLRQDHPGHAAGRAAAQHPDRLRLRRPDGGRQDGRHRGRRARQARPDRRDDRRRQRRRHRRAARRDRALRLPDLRLLLRHVHRQLDELPHRGDRPGPARQRLDAGHPRRPQGALRARPARIDRRHRQAATTRTTTSRCCPAASPPGTPSRTRSPSTWRWAAPPTRCCTCSPPPARPSSTSTSPTSTPSPAGCRAWRRSPRTPRSTTWRTCTGPAASPPSSASWTAAALLHRDVHSVHSPDLARAGSPTGTSAAARPPPRRSSCSTPRPAGSAPPQPFSTDQPLGHPGHRRRRRLHPRRSSTPTPPTAAWPILLRQPRPRRLRRQDRRACPRRVWTFTRPGARVFESQDDAVNGILGKQVVAGDVVVIRYEGPRAAPACRRCSTRRRSSRDAAWARPARSSPTAGSPAAPPACPSGTSPPRRPPAG